MKEKPGEIEEKCDAQERGHQEKRACRGGEWEQVRE